MKRYYVYVIELDPSVADQKKFWAKNPKYISGKSCVYVGQSSRKPSLRFAQHKEGYKSNKYAKVYGLKLRPDLYEQYNPIPTRKDAEAIEEMLGIGLRNRGYGVWFNWCEPLCPMEILLWYRVRKRFFMYRHGYWVSPMNGKRSRPMMWNQASLSTVFIRQENKWKAEQL